MIGCLMKDRNDKWECSKIAEIVPDVVAHSAHGILIWSAIGAKPVERSELECLIWWITIRKHTFINRVWYKIMILIYVGAHSEHVQVIRWDFKPGSVKRSIDLDKEGIPQVVNYLNYRNQ
jgi:hypothetical protein